MDDELLEGLDDAQLAAATALSGPVRIIAGAGAGKTRTVTRRIAHACVSGEWEASRVLAVTFSVKAAAEMRVRLESLGVGDQVTASTFHSAALRQLRRVWPDVCEAPFPHLVEDTRDITRRAMRRVGLTDDMDDITVRAVRDEINWAKISLVAPGEVERVAVAVERCTPAGIEASRFADIYDAYELEKAARGEMDFDDILLMMCHVLEEFDEQAARVRKSIGWLTVDEYQDVSPLQHRLMRLWLGDNRNVCVVGDPAQTIYSFAGASSYDLLAFADEFKPLSADIRLGTDYRSTPQVVNYANRVLAASPMRRDYLRLSSARGNGARVSRKVYETDALEAQGVAMRIAKLVADGANPSDCAILTRINAQQAACCSALRAVRLGYRVRRDSGWTASSSVADLEAAGQLALADTMREHDDETTRKLGKVTVSTIHAAKGLEFKHVFVIGCSEGLLPYGYAQDDDALEEERRLMYVAITRAEDTLHMSYARSKDGMGERQRSLSRFLS